MRSPVAGSTAVLADVQTRGMMGESGALLGLGQTTPKWGPHRLGPVGLRDQFTGKPGLPDRNCSPWRLRVQRGKSLQGLGKAVESQPREC